MSLQNFEVWATRKHDDGCIIEDQADMDLLQYVNLLKNNDGIYDSKHGGWIPYHRINYICRGTE
jgi:hypothetical protein